MTKDDDNPPTPSPSGKPLRAADLRAQRLKVALMANMARRKAQARARSGADTSGVDSSGDAPEADMESE